MNRPWNTLKREVRGVDLDSPAGKAASLDCQRINLDEPGAIVFFGTVNSFPMMYARELRRMNQQVVYFVEVPRRKTLHRPEAHYPEITYPYPKWIVEFFLPTQLLANTFPRLVAGLMLRRARRINNIDKIKAVVVGGHFISLLPYFPDPVVKTLLASGADLHSWCNTSRSNALAAGIFNQSIFRFLPKFVTKTWVNSMVRKNFRSAKCANNVVYFPRGMSPEGDRIVSELEASGVRYLPRYDVSFDVVKEASRNFKEPGDKLVILSPVRFSYKTFPDGNSQNSKGNDIIIQGLSMYKSINKQIEVHFVEKGEDCDHAKSLCDELGLTESIVWHKEMSMNRLLDLYQKADICFDQVGSHWVGAIGVYGLYLGKPVIANAANLTFLGESPILQAATPEEVCARLVALSDPAFREKVSCESKRFAEDNFSPGTILGQITTPSSGHKEQVRATSS